MAEARGCFLLSVIFTLEQLKSKKSYWTTGAIAEYPTHIVSPRRHSLKNESEYNRGYSYANRWI